MSNRPKIKKKSENNCPCCAMSVMLESLEKMDEWMGNVAKDAVGEDAEYKASQLTVAFTNAQGSMMILRDLFLEFSRTYFPDRIERHVH